MIKRQYYVQSACHENLGVNGRFAVCEEYSLTKAGEILMVVQNKKEML